jgi:hypothetical protein
MLSPSGGGKVVTCGLSGTFRCPQRPHFRQWRVHSDTTQSCTSPCDDTPALYCGTQCFDGVHCYREERGRPCDGILL